MSGTTNYVTRWTDANTLGTSTIYDNGTNVGIGTASPSSCLLYTSDAADDLLCVDLGGRRIIKKKKK